jgi:hypothetical protein
MEIGYSFGVIGAIEEGIPQGLKPIFITVDMRGTRLKPWGTQKQV